MIAKPINKAASSATRLLLVAFVFAIGMKHKAYTQPTSTDFTAAWWNVENLFDTRDDPATDDDEFTPKGERHWTHRKFNAKIQGIAKTIIMMGCPDVVGLAEVENKYVLNELCHSTPLVRFGYRYVHFDSPDRRGIDCALLYRTERFYVDQKRAINVSDSIEGKFTRDILQVMGRTASGDTMVLLLNHWPSRLGGDEADAYRLRIADTLRRRMVREHRRRPTAAILAMGDMNSDPEDPAVTIGMRFGHDTVSSDGIINLTYLLPRSLGSYKYRGEWEYIDQVFLLSPKDSWTVAQARVADFKHLLIAERNRPGSRPRRTNQGLRYEGGLSDHLPLLFVLRRE